MSQYPSNNKWNKHPHSIPSDMIIIGVAGEAEHGKGEIAKLARDGYDFTEEGFAFPGKEAAKCIFDLTDSDVYSTRGKAEIDPYWNITRRTMLQKLLSDCLKPVFGRDIWVRRMHLTLGRLYHNGIRKVIISDLRFTEEVDYIINEMGGDIIFVWAPNRENSLTPEEKNHESETTLTIDNLSQLTNGRGYLIRNEGGLEDLRLQAASALTQIMSMRK